jgi:monofunctional biosynthetic peptidoglycan transglycosylase
MSLLCLKKTLKRLYQKLTRLVLKILFSFLILSFLLVLLFRFAPVPFTPLMCIRLTEQALDPDRTVSLKKKWTPLEKIAVNLQKAVIAAEDQNFISHSGFDTEAIKKALEHNRKWKGKRLRGASTISQQTAKNLFLWPSRSWLRKGLEAYFTLLIELLWSKKRILEVYLNIIETGEGMYGVEAASQHYFKKSAAKLNRQEAALLAACLPNPRKWSPTRPTAYLMKRQAWILRHLNQVVIPEQKTKNQK